MAERRYDPDIPGPRRPYSQLLSGRYPSDYDNNRYDGEEDRPGGEQRRRRAPPPRAVRRSRSFDEEPAQPNSGVRRAAEREDAYEIPYRPRPGSPPSPGPRQDVRPPTEGAAERRRMPRPQPNYEPPPYQSPPSPSNDFLRVSPYSSRPERSPNRSASNSISDGRYSPEPERLTPSPRGSPAAPDRRQPEPASYLKVIASEKSAGPSTLGNRHYQYKALDDSFIRLIKLFPEKKTMIKCEMVHVSLNDPPRYVAVSYAWGDAGDTRKIDLEGSAIPIAVSLHGALHALRHRTETLLVWADALCIDQDNKDERTQQVQLMTRIYASAESVAIWLGPEEDDSKLAVEFLSLIAERSESGKEIRRLLASQKALTSVPAVVSLFERDYWMRLWVVQEITNAASIVVYCGTTATPWPVYKLAAETLHRHYKDITHLFPSQAHGEGEPVFISLKQSAFDNVLGMKGPCSIPDVDSFTKYGEGMLLELMRACREKLASDPKDKLFGILGILPPDIRNEFRADYNLSAKDVYTEIVDYLIKTTGSLDVIIDAVYFPLVPTVSDLPTFVPDWSQITRRDSFVMIDTSFKAAGYSKADCRFLDERLSKLEISAIYLGTVEWRGIAVGAINSQDEFLMAFLHYRARLLQDLGEESNESPRHVLEQFAMTLSLGKIPHPWTKPSQWASVCYYLFVELLRNSLPYLKLDRELLEHLKTDVDIKPEERWPFFDRTVAKNMEGNCFFRTSRGHMCLGTGSLSPGDIVVVPLGCSSPVVLRKRGMQQEYRFVGDAYVDLYMHGRAVDEWKQGKLKLRKYILR